MSHQQAHPSEDAQLCQLFCDSVRSPLSLMVFNRQTHLLQTLLTRSPDVPLSYLSALPFTSPSSPSEDTQLCRLFCDSVRSPLSLMVFSRQTHPLQTLLTHLPDAPLSYLSALPFTYLPPPTPLSGKIVDDSISLLFSSRFRQATLPS